MEPQEDMEAIYSVFPWPEDEESYKRRVEEARERFTALLGHEWLSSTAGKSRVRVLDLMGGTGVGGVGMALALSRLGTVVDVTVVDARESALARAREYARSLYGIRVEAVQGSVEDLPGIVECPFDVLVLYGQSTPHLDPYAMVRTAAGMAACTSRDGVAVVEEGDRVYTVLYLAGYKHVLPEEATPDRLVVGYHSGYDTRRGVFRRLLVDHYTGRRAMAEVRFWDIAGTASILWAFYQDVDLVPVRPPGRVFLLARGPRGIDPAQYRGTPRIASGV